MIYDYVPIRRNDLRLCSDSTSMLQIRQDVLQNNDSYPETIGQLHTAFGVALNEDVGIKQLRSVRQLTPLA